MCARRQRGLSRSAPADAGLAKDEQAEDVRGLLRALGLGPAAHVVGHDIGGMVAFCWARRYPDEVRSLTPERLLTFLGQPASPRP